MQGRRVPAGASWRTWALAACLVAVAATIAALALLTRRVPADGNGAPPPAAAAMPESDRLFMSGVEYAAYDGAEPTFRLRARSLVHRKRRVGPLTFNPVKEVEMDGVRIEIYASRAGEAGRAAAPSLEGILQGTLLSKNLGFVSRIRLLDLEIDDRRGGAGAPDRLTAAEAVWRPGERQLDVSGGFEYADESGTQRGATGAFTLAGGGRLRRVR